MKYVYVLFRNDTCDEITETLLIFEDEDDANFYKQLFINIDHSGCAEYFVNKMKVYEKDEKVIFE